MTAATLQFTWLCRDLIQARLPDLSLVIAFEVGFCVAMFVAVTLS